MAEEDEPEYCSLQTCILYAVLGVVLFGITLFTLLKLCICLRTRSQLRKWKLHRSKSRAVVVGFFHPYCNAGGGGERVLWQSICALQKRYSFIRCVIYANFTYGVGPDQILSKAQERFNISLSENVEFIYLHRHKWVEPRCWPRFTILGQSLGSMVLGLEGLFKLAPDVFVDTTGYAFVVPLFRWLGGSKTVSYVHYPTVSRDMLDKVRSCESTYNNSSSISQSKLLTNLKLVYYRIYARLYGFAGRRNDVVMVNSTWTHGHIAKIWNPRRLYIVYPPCDISAFEELPIRRDTKRKFSIVSIGQFRPEKNHELQLTVFSNFLRKLEKSEKKHVELVLIGSCRNDEDTNRLGALRRLAKNLKLDNKVRYETNISFERLKKELSRASVGLHTMWNEHFGIGLVECMAAGCVMIGHNSGGPKMDIVVDWKGQATGLLAGVEEQYVNCLLRAFRMEDREREMMVSSAREAVRTKFSVEVFEDSFIRATEHLFT